VLDVLRDLPARKSPRCLISPSKEPCNATTAERGEQIGKVSVLHRLDSGCTAFRGDLLDVPERGIRFYREPLADY
jgi:hypothetical protein